LIQKKSIILNILALTLPLTITACNQSVNDEAIHNYIASHPEEIISAVTAYRDNKLRHIREKQFEQVRNISSRFTSQSRVTFNPKGTVPVIKIVDYNCGFCRASFPAIKNKLAKEWKNVKLTIIPLPILSGASKNAVLYTRLAAGNSEVQQKVLAGYLSFPQLGPGNSNVLASQFGLDGSKIAALEDGLNADLKTYESMSIAGTPSFIVDGRIIIGFKEKDIQDAINEASL
jgi:protein-disulfide isomerase